MNPTLWDDHLLARIKERASDENMPSTLSGMWHEMHKVMSRDSLGGGDAEYLAALALNIMRQLVGVTYN